MDNYPLGKDQTMALLYLAALPEGSEILSLGGRDSLLLLSRSGYKGSLLPGGLRGRKSFLESDFPEQSFDGILSQGELYEEGDMEKCLLKAGKLLKKGGRLMMSELCLEPWDQALKAAGLQVLSCEDISSMWRVFYMDRLFSGEDVPEWVEGKFKYYTMVCQKL